MKKIFILGTIIFVFTIRFLFNDSFSKYNQTPRKLVEQYLKEHYGKEFELVSSEYLEVGRYPGPYLWKFRYRDEEGQEFSIQCSHPAETSNTGYCIMFYKQEARIDDYYWAKVLLEEYGEELKLKDKVAETSVYGPEDYTYDFIFNTEEEMGEMAHILAQLTVYTCEKVKEPFSKVFSGYIYYKDDVIWESPSWFDEAYEEYSDGDGEELVEFFYNKMLKAKQYRDDEEVEEQQYINK